GAWTVLGTIAPPPNSGSLAFGPNGLLYAVGGSDGSVVDTYNPGTNTWSPAASLLLDVSEVDAITGFGLTGSPELFAIAGLLGYKYPYEAYAVEVLDPVSNAWVE